MLKLGSLVALLLIGMTLCCAGIAAAEPFPVKPVRIVTGEAGGSNDFAARVITSGLTASLGQQVIVDNRTGPVSISVVAKAQPDGYSLLLYSGGLWLLPLMQADIPWNGERDFANITIATSQPAVLVVHPSLAVNSTKDLIALAKAKSGDINYSSGSTGGPAHLATELFKSMAGVNMVRVNYKGASAAVNAVIANQVPVTISSGGSVGPHIKSGRLKALAVTSAQPSVLFPGLTTIAASGLPGYEATTIQAIFAPAHTPAPLINRLNEEIVRVLRRADVIEKYLSYGVEAVGSTSQQVTARMKSELTKWSPLIKTLGAQE